MGLAAGTIGILAILVVAIAGLASRRASAGSVLRAALAWIAIGAVVFLIVSQRHHVSRLLYGAADVLDGPQQRAVGRAVHIRMADDGHFWAQARLNGIDRRMMIDSGATFTTVSDKTARAIGLAVGADARRVRLETPNGVIEVPRAMLEKLDVGSLGTRDIEVVVASNFGDTDVIGMNFLSRLKSWRVEGRTLILEPAAPGQDFT